MPSARVVVETAIERTPRVAQLQGLFDVPPAPTSGRSWDVQLPLTDRAWAIGLVVGPSGCGKSTIARHFWPDQLAHAFSWSRTQSILDGFPAGMSIKEIVALLSSVGFSDVPNWVRPFQVLSTGEQFRVT